MKIGIVSDHRGYKLKQKLIEELTKLNYEMVDYGTDSEKSVDYPDYAFILGENVVNKNVDFGVAICGSGIGISIACNKVKGIRCAKVENEQESKITRNDNNANIVAFSSEMPLETALNIVTNFVNTPFSSEERHQKRIYKITNYEVK